MGHGIKIIESHAADVLVKKYFLQDHVVQNEQKSFHKMKFNEVKILLQIVNDFFVK